MTFELVSRGDGDLKTRYRPQTWSEIVPTFPVERVKSMVNDPKSSRILLFVGQSGVGKTTAARIFARTAVCEALTPAGEPCLECEKCTKLESSPDYSEINIANFRKIDDVRDFVQGFGYRPMYLAKKIYVLDEVHQLTPDAQQVLLKVLEEPPDSLLVILCTTETKGLKRTLLSRCTEVRFNPLTMDDAARIADTIFAPTPKKAKNQPLDQVFQRADGSVREYLNHLEALLADAFEATPAEDAAPASVVDLASALMARDWLNAKMILAKPEVKQAPESFRLMTTCYLRGVALRRNKVDFDVAFPLGQLAGSTHAEPQAEQYNLLVLRCMRACSGKKTK